jgi:TGS domain
MLHPSCNIASTFLTVFWLSTSKLSLVNFHLASFKFSTNVFSAKPRSEINVALPDGKIYAGKSWETTPANVAQSISKSLSDQTVIAEVDGELWDLDRPLEQSCSLKLLNFEDPEGKQSSELLAGKREAQSDIVCSKESVLAFFGPRSWGGGRE